MPTDPLAAGLAKAGIATAERHLFLCMGPDCCTRAEAEVVWEYIKRRVKETGLPAMRTKAECFRICVGGPWIVVYPEGVWYTYVDAHDVDEIVDRHLVKGEIVDRLRI